MTLDAGDLANQLFEQLQSQLLDASPPPDGPVQGMQHMANAIAEAIVPYLLENIVVSLPDGTKATVT